MAASWCLTASEGAGDAQLPEEPLVIVKVPRSSCSAPSRKRTLAPHKFRNATMPFVVCLPVALNRQRAGANSRRTAMSVLIFSPVIRRLTLGAAALTFVSPALAQTVVVPSAPEQ